VVRCAKQEVPGKYTHSINRDFGSGVKLGTLQRYAQLGLWILLSGSPTLRCGCAASSCSGHDFSSEESQIVVHAYNNNKTFRTYYYGIATTTMPYLTRGLETLSL
jgi:hypothetical protein